MEQVFPHNAQKDSSLLTPQSQTSSVRNVRQYISIVQDLPDGTVDKNPPANTGNEDLIPDPGRFHMPWSN